MLKEQRIKIEKIAKEIIKKWNQELATYSWSTSPNSNDESLMARFELDLTIALDKEDLDYLFSDLYNVIDENWTGILPPFFPSA